MWSQINIDNVPLVEFMSLVFTSMPGESYRWQLRSLLLCLCNVFWALINSLVCWLKITITIILTSILMQTKHVWRRENCKTVTCLKLQPEPVGTILILQMPAIQSWLWADHSVNQRFNPKKHPVPHLSCCSSIRLKNKQKTLAHTGMQTQTFCL